MSRTELSHERVLAVLKLRERWEQYQRAELPHEKQSLFRKFLQRFVEHFGDSQDRYSKYALLFYLSYNQPNACVCVCVCVCVLFYVVW
jgi:hypothetical protein